jgi:hypothetical protein
MAIPIFDPRIADLDKKQAELLEQALQLGATPEMLNTVLRGAVSPNYTLPTDIAQNVPVGAEFNEAAKGSRYPDLTDRNSILGGISRVVAGETPILNPYLFNGVTRPTSDATTQVDIGNRNARIQNQNQSMLNAVNTIGGLFNGGGRTAENTKGTTAEQGLVLSNLLPLLKGRAPSYVVGGSLGVQDARDAGITENQIKSQESINKDKSDIIDEVKNGTRTAPSAQRMLDVVQERQNKLDRAVERQGNKSTRFDEDRKKLLEDLGEDTTEVQKRINNPNAPSVPTTELPEDINTDATVTISEEGDGTSPEGAEDKQNWFDAINDRVDLMAMGAAMLASSGQAGANTLSRLGSGLQAGIASRSGQAKAIQDKQYKDALLLLKAQQARAAGIPKLFANKPAQVDRIEGNLRNVGVSGDNLSVLANQLWTMDSTLSSMPYDITKDFYEEFAKIGKGWLGSTIDSDDVDSAARQALENLNKRRAAK